MDTNEIPEIKEKEINGQSISNLEISKISMICDYLILDRFSDISSFLRFEKCFGPLFTKENKNFLPDAFQEICGPKKKYINFGRLILAYIKWKTNSSKNESFNKFMKTVFDDMIQTKDKSIGSLGEGGMMFNTRNTRGRQIISKFTAYTDESKNNIKGFKIQYDDVFDVLLTKKKSKESKVASLEINFPPNSKIFLDRDGISHIAGKYSVTNEYIKFLIFKCRSGKTFYIGDNSEDDQEEIKLFIFGATNCHLRSLRLRLVQERLVYIEPNFQSSLRVNQKLLPFDSIDEKFIKENIANSPLIFEENEIQNIPIEELDLNTLLIPCVEDDAFIDKESLVEKNCGKNFDEVYSSYRNENSNEEDKSKQEKEELKKEIYNKTIQRKHLLKIYFNKFKVKENILVLKNSSEQPKERIDMDKHLVNIESAQDILDSNDNKKINQIKNENENVIEENKIEEEKSKLKEPEKESKDEDNKIEIIEDSKEKVSKKKEKPKKEIERKNDKNILNKSDIGKKKIKKYDESKQNNKEELEKDTMEEERSNCPNCIII
jgi:hypothetical protein